MIAGIKTAVSRVFSNLNDTASFFITLYMATMGVLVPTIYVLSPRSEELSGCNAIPSSGFVTTTFVLPLISITFAVAAIVLLIKWRSTAFSIVIVASFILFTVFAFAAVFATYGLLPDTEHIAKTRWDYLYFSAVTFTTLGYGDLQPCPSVRLVAALEGFMGYATIGLFISASFNRSGSTGSRQRSE